MNKVWIAAICSMGLFACGRDKPAEDPSSTTTSVITTETTTTPAAPNATPGTATPTTTGPIDGRDQTYAGGMENKTSTPMVESRTDDKPMKTADAKPAVGADGKPLNDRDITAAIRRAVVADKALSFSAKNVHIDTNAGKVTLKGSVKSDDEKSSIEAKAKSAPGVSTVDNQIDVKK